MDLKKESERIDQNLIEFRKYLGVTLDSLKEKLAVASAEYAIHAAESDKSENAALDGAIETLNSVNSELINVEMQINNIDMLQDSLDEYEHTPYISEFSTVYLRLVGEKSIKGLPDEFVFKLFPNNICEVDMGIIPAEGRVGSILISKKKGDFITIRHEILKLADQYMVVDFY